MFGHALGTLLATPLLCIDREPKPPRHIHGPHSPAACLALHRSCCVGPFASRTLRRAPRGDPAILDSVNERRRVMAAAIPFSQISLGIAHSRQPCCRWTLKNHQHLRPRPSFVDTKSGKAWPARAYGSASHASHARLRSIALQCRTPQGPLPALPSALPHGKATHAMHGNSPAATRAAG